MDMIAGDEGIGGDRASVPIVPIRDVHSRHDSERNADP